MKLVIAATGASGAVYLQRLLEQIDCATHEVHLVTSVYAREVAKQELDDFKIPAEVSQHSESDMNVPFVSGSARFDAMVIVPCSMATLGRIASGSSDSVLLRAADVFLKERRKLILVPRETPWNLIHARNVVTLLEAGAIVLPAFPLFTVVPVLYRHCRHSGLAHTRPNRIAHPGCISLGPKGVGENFAQKKLKIEGRLARWLIAFGVCLLRAWGAYAALPN